MTQTQTYRAMLKDYPDVLNINDMSNILSVSVKTAYKLLREQEIKHLKVGREYRIPKINLINYLLLKERA
jgi:excisionase family DNA binding protein